MNKSLLLYSIFIIFFQELSYQYIVIPFKNINTKQPQSFNFNDISGENFLEFSQNKLVSSISIGTPYTSLELYLTMDYRLFFIGKGYCLKNSESFYRPSKSSSFRYINNLYYHNPFNDLRNMTVGNDKCTLYNNYNLNSNISLNSLQLYYGSIVDFSDKIYDKEKICGVMGFKLHYEKSYYGELKGLEYTLKMNDINNSSFWSIEFFNETQRKKNNNFDGYIILGAADNKYLKGIRNVTYDNIHFAYNSYTTGSLEWMITFQSIFYYDLKDNITKMNYEFSNVAFNFDNKYYFMTKEYFESIQQNFFGEYISKGICAIHCLKEFYLKYKYITCHRNTFIEEKKKFPKIYLFSSALNYTFELNYNDLFIDLNDDILFLMFYDPWNPKVFRFGEKFLSKYNFIFQIDQKNIGFINFDKEDKKSEEEKKRKIIANKKKFEIIWIIVLSVLLVGIIIGIFVGKKLWDNKRKKRANELVDDDYEYKSKKDAIIPIN